MRVFILASIAPATAVFEPSAHLSRIALKPDSSTTTMPANSAPSTAQIAVIFAISIAIDAPMPGNMNE